MEVLVYERDTSERERSFFLQLLHLTSTPLQVPLPCPTSSKFPSKAPSPTCSPPLPYFPQFPFPCPTSFKFPPGNQEAAWALTPSATPAVNTAARQFYEGVGRLAYQGEGAGEKALYLPLISAQVPVNDNSKTRSGRRKSSFEILDNSRAGERCPVIGAGASESPGLPLAE
ncbi:hypothetical protein Pmani_019354 [Petrolisthes manimaculis]|uniref:Uncharacterized protein n=1 Tax=Petrolisthes manimaculis TaxID=1843537 RepID=A0AAE1PKZ4_9EUCA|nr:hypothetical protein Pmani_019354 [Petrolisthes manimaculis]